VPKSVTSTYYGRSSASGTCYFGDNTIHVARAGMEILNPLADDSTVADWAAASKLWEHAISSRLTSPRARNALNNEPAAGAMDVDGGGAEAGFLAEHPLLVTEPSANAGRARERTIELALEDWGSPAFWLVRAGVAAAFAAGKPTALVVDLGAASATASAVLEGLLLRKSVQRSALAGDFVSDQLRVLLAQRQPGPIALHPYYTVASKTAVEPNAAAAATYRAFAAGQAPTRSFHRLQEARLLTELKESVVQVYAPGPLARASAEQMQAFGGQQARPFEFPDGYNTLFGAERLKAAEGLFDPKAILTSAGQPAPGGAQGLAQLVRASLEQVDVDVRPSLLMNVVVTGGTSLIQGLVERLSTELQGMYPSLRIRVTSPGNVYERRFGSWIGGSILASLGTFHQMWISKKEYEEFGAVSTALSPGLARDADLHHRVLSRRGASSRKRPSRTRCHQDRSTTETAAPEPRHRLRCHGLAQRRHGFYYGRSRTHSSRHLS